MSSSNVNGDLHIVACPSLLHSGEQRGPDTATVAILADTRLLRGYSTADVTGFNCIFVRLANGCLRFCNEPLGIRKWLHCSGDGSLKAAYNEQERDNGRILLTSVATSTARELTKAIPATITIDFSCQQVTFQHAETVDVLTIDIVFRNRLLTPRISTCLRADFIHIQSTKTVSVVHFTLGCFRKNLWTRQGWVEQDSKGQSRVAYKEIERSATSITLEDSYGTRICLDLREGVVSIGQKSHIAIYRIHAVEDMLHNGSGEDAVYIECEGTVALWEVNQSEWRILGTSLGETWSVTKKGKNFLNLQAAIHSVVVDIVQGTVDIIPQTGRRRTHKIAKVIPRGHDIMSDCFQNINRIEANGNRFVLSDSPALQWFQNDDQSVPWRELGRTNLQLELEALCSHNKRTLTVDFRRGLVHTTSSSDIHKLQAVYWKPKPVAPFGPSETNISPSELKLVYLENGAYLLEQAEGEWTMNTTDGDVVFQLKVEAQTKTSIVMRDVLGNVPLSIYLESGWVFAGSDESIHRISSVYGAGSNTSLQQQNETLIDDRNNIAKVSFSLGFFMRTGDCNWGLCDVTGEVQQYFQGTIKATSIILENPSIKVRIIICLSTRWILYSSPQNDLVYMYPILRCDTFVTCETVTLTLETGILQRWNENTWIESRHDLQDMLIYGTQKSTQSSIELESDSCKSSVLVIDFRDRSIRRSSTDEPDRILDAALIPLPVSQSGKASEINEVRLHHFLFKQNAPSVWSQYDCDGVHIIDWEEVDSANSKMKLVSAQTSAIFIFDFQRMVSFAEEATHKLATPILSIQYANVPMGPHLSTLAVTGFNVVKVYHSRRQFFFERLRDNPSCWHECNSEGRELYRYEETARTQVFVILRRTTDNALIALDVKDNRVILQKNVFFQVIDESMREVLPPRTHDAAFLTSECVTSRTATKIFSNLGFYESNGNGTWTFFDAGGHAVSLLYDIPSPSSGNQLRLRDSFDTRDVCFNLQLNQISVQTSKESSSVPVSPIKLALSNWHHSKSNNLMDWTLYLCFEFAKPMADEHAIVTVGKTQLLISSGGFKVTDGPDFSLVGNFTESKGRHCVSLDVKMCDPTITLIVDNGIPNSHPFPRVVEQTEGPMKLHKTPSICVHQAYCVPMDVAERHR